MITDPWFYAAAVPAVLVFGISKGGFPGVAVISIPLMALIMSPVQAAAIMLPILCVMDLVTVWAFRRRWVLPELRALLPGALLGIGVGTLTFGLLDANAIKLIVGAIALVFTLHRWLDRQTAGRRADAPWPVGVLAGIGAGFTSFIAHAGGPPFSVYLLRRPVDKTQFMATAAVFFAVVNYVKLVPYAWLGQLSGENLLQSAVLAPLAPVGVAAGVWLHRRASDEAFFRVAYLFLFLVGLKLIRDGVAGLA